MADTALIPLKNPYSGSGCFFCGPLNPIGLRLSFFRTQAEPPELLCRLTPGPHYRGLGRILHGGIQCGLFDEIMGWTAHQLAGESAVTGDLAVEFLAPVFVEEPLEVRCRLASQEGRRVSLAAEIRNAAGDVCSRATGTYVQVPFARFQELVGSEE